MILELDDPGCRIDSRGPCPEDRVDAMVRVERGRTHQRFVEWDVAAEVRLRKRRPFIRGLVLSADQRHGPIGALLSQRDGGRGPSQARADDHVRFGHHTSIWSASPSTRVR